MQPTPILQRALRRLQLTTKQAGKDYYKGNRVGSHGRHTKHGKYIIEWQKVRTYVCPRDLENSSLTPFVARRIEIERGTFAGTKGPMDGEAYLERWKAENGQD
ncbi:uncharacterized protein BDZ99DRAFT_382883 [Mytilinidion resinicola]|uniref:50S ribosomal protein-like protein YmL27 n=1 Tax=Mytilinidion resinicola TaxID=574789 RepID=A0A6A6YV59_9PEZI|nr:uncharacterized protein BDZ99DRAFT_382883 [Mytilinidion resinicola]KAF2812263.1 hypothetical protein BDZ99DRAFT_382883 [Mytilinidion resinicola]